MEVNYDMPQIHEQIHDQILSVKEQSMGDQILQDARQAVDGTESFKAAKEEAHADVQKLNAMTTDGSETSHATRAMLAVVKENDAKLQVRDAAFARCNFEPATITGTDDIAQRRVDFLQYRQAEVDLLENAKAFRTHLRQALIKEGIPDDDINQIMPDPKMTRRFDLLVTLCNAVLKAADDQIARFDFLNQTYGTWSGTNGQIIFHDHASFTSYNALIQNLHDDNTVIQETMKQYVQ